jgi:hypothetical protein
MANPSPSPSIPRRAAVLLASPYCPVFRYLDIYWSDAVRFGLSPMMPSSFLVDFSLLQHKVHFMCGANAAISKHQKMSAKNK